MLTRSHKLSFILALLILILHVLACSSMSPRRPQPTPTAQPVIQVQEDGKSTTITFSSEEMDKIEHEVEAGDTQEASEYVSRKLAEAGVKCCQPRKRISDCVWRCCNKTMVTTCNQTL